MRKPLVLSFVLLFLCFIHSSSQTTQQNKLPSGAIEGKVIVRLSGQPIAGAVVSIEDKAETTTDTEGRYRLEISPGTYGVRVRASGFASIVISEISVTANRTLINDVQLEVTIKEDVDVRSEVFTATAEQPVSNTTLNRAEIRATPGTGGDPLRAVNSLPQVTINSAEFADLIVRGGSFGENLTFIENIPVADFTYFTDQYDNGRGGRATILAPDVIDRMDFSAGGFGVRYGDRMSSVLDVRLREAARNRVQGTIFADSGNAGLSVEIPLGKRGGWLVSARRSYIDVAFDIANIGDIGQPRNFDFFNKVTYDISPRNTINFTAINLFERFTLNREQATRTGRRIDALETVRTSQRTILGLTLNTVLGAKTLSQITAWGNIQHNDGSFLRTDFSHILQRARDLRDSQFGIKEELTAAISPRFQLALGGGLIFDQSNYFTFERTGFGFSPLEEEFNAPTRSNRLRLETKTSAYAYAQTTWRPTQHFSITPGIRVDRYGLTEQTLFSPRLSARFDVNSKVALTFASGVYRQPPSLFVFSLAPNNQNLKAQRAVHFIGGIEWLARENVRLRAEVFNKSYDNLAVQPVRGVPNYFNTGEGYARGFEISVQKALSGKFAGQASYSFVRSRRKFNPNGFEFPSDLERPHQLILIGITRIYGFTVAGKLRVASGLPYTPRVPVEIFPFTFLQRIARPEDTNTARLPNFASFDLRVERRFNFKRFSFAPYVDFFNLTKHASTTELSYEFFSRQPLLLQERDMLPIFGLKIEF